MTDICILGGGVAGLTAALQLAERGLRPVLLEADPQAFGGRLRDTAPIIVRDGETSWEFPSEHGVHGIWSPYANFRALLERYHALPTFIPSEDETWIFGRDKVVRKAAIGKAIRSSPVPAPFHYLAMLVRPRFMNILTIRDLLGLFLVEGSLIGALAIDPLAEGKALDGMTLADFTRGWTPTVRSLFAGLARNALAADPEHAPAAGFISFLRFYTLLRRDAWAFNYLAGTGGSLVVAPMAAAARERGADLRLGTRATELARDGQRWLVHYTDVDGQQQTTSADTLVLALDAPGAERLLRTSAPTAERAATMRFPKGVPTVILRLWFRTTPRNVASSGICTGDFVIDNFFWLHCMQPAYQQWHATTGGSAVEVHIYGPESLWQQPDAALLAQTVTDIYRAFPELRGQLLWSDLARNAATHTLFTPGDPAQTLQVETPWPNMVACGDWIGHANPAMYLERAVTTAMVAANTVLNQLALEPMPIQPHPAPEWLAGRMSAALTRFRHRQLHRRRGQ